MNIPEPNTKPPQNEAVFLRFADALSQMRSDAEKAHTARITGQPLGPISGLPNLDREIGHAFAPGLHGMHGNAGTGKTAMALQIAASCQFPSLYVTCEMSAAELLRRHTAWETATYLGRFKSGELAPDQVETLARRALQACPQFCLLDATMAPAISARILECGQIVKQQSENGQMLMIVDSQQSWVEGVTSEAGSEYESLNIGIKSQREIAHRLECPIIFISERNRDSMKNGGLNAGAGTRKIEYGTETVIDLERDREAREDGVGEVNITLQLAKNRHGTVGRKISLKFNGALQKFRELDTNAGVRFCANWAPSTESKAYDGGRAILYPLRDYKGELRAVAGRYLHPHLNSPKILTAPK